jgi:nicotinamide mononucleotide transporter PnuC
MKKIRLVGGYFTFAEKLLWGCSVLLIIVSFAIFDRANYLTLAASLVGATSLILNAKGNPLGQLLAVIFSVMYAVISYSYSYYGEMITYLGMTAPMALAALISWLKNPYEGNRSEVRVNAISGRETAFMLVLSAVVTAVFYFILKAFGTANLLPSTLSITTSFLAVYLTFRRNPYYAIAYCANDVILIAMWTMATVTDISYISVILCFVMFLANDIYGFVNWRKMQKRQSGDSL